MQARDVAIDIIIPVLNEENVLQEQARYYEQLSQAARVIFVDGGSTDQTVALCQRYGEVARSPKGRGIQKNAGARCADQKVLLFLHVDCCVEVSTLPKILDAVKKGSVAGCLQMKIADDKLIFRMYEAIVNARGRYCHIFDGDLGFFIDAERFAAIGGFDPLPCMEDILIGKRLKGQGQLTALDLPILVSSRKWYAQGFVRTLFKYMRSYLRLWSGRL